MKCKDGTDCRSINEDGQCEGPCETLPDIRGAPLKVGSLVAFAADGDLVCGHVTATGAIYAASLLGVCVEDGDGRLRLVPIDGCVVLD